LERHTSVDPDDILYEVFEDVTQSMACDHEVRHRRAGEDSRRQWYPLQIGLMRVLSDKWASRLANQQAEVLRGHPFDDRPAADSSAPLPPVPQAFDNSSYFDAIQSRMLDVTTLVRDGLVFVNPPPDQAMRGTDLDHHGGDPVDLPHAYVPPGMAMSDGEVESDFVRDDRPTAPRRFRKASNREWRRVVRRLCDFAAAETLIDDLFVGPPRVPKLAYGRDEFVEELYTAGLVLDELVEQLDQSPLREDARACFRKIFANAEKLSEFCNRIGPQNDDELRSLAWNFAASCAELKQLVAERAVFA
jgi:hypothetical protein